MTENTEIIQEMIQRYTAQLGVTSNYKGYIVNDIKICTFR